LISDSAIDTLLDDFRRTRPFSADELIHFVVVVDTPLMNLITFRSISKMTLAIESDHRKFFNFLRQRNFAFNQFNIFLLLSVNPNSSLSNRNLTRILSNLDDMIMSAKLLYIIFKLKQFSNPEYFNSNCKNCNYILQLHIPIENFLVVHRQAQRRQRTHKHRRCISSTYIFIFSSLHACD
jgi:hypothetical protein